MSMDVATFTKLVEEARAKRSDCCYCGADLSHAALKDVMYMKGKKRIACANCPEALVIEFASTGT